MSAFHESLGRALERTAAQGGDVGVLAGVGAWANHDDPRDEWPGADDWNLEHLAGIISDAEDTFWTAYHRACEQGGDDAGDALGTQYGAIARRILTGPELAAHDAEVRAAERERVAAAIEAIIGPDEVFPDWSRYPHRHRVTMKRRDLGADVTTTVVDERAIRNAIARATEVLQ